MGGIVSPEKEKFKSQRLDRFVESICRKEVSRPRTCGGGMSLKGAKIRILEEQSPVGARRKSAKKLDLQRISVF